ncbi:uncharacterized protein LOC127751129 [Frankliniella occidentalis]|uniref:Uncharacterized protein LOC127751129 n=1 Tax=Frankliniella occidentalis TaxID=133901 RepID=A0A9C6X6U6_FRAOC|nr:uncharacterized protein LOC127751129 [Frankliniella occidentalis]
MPINSMRYKVTDANGRTSPAHLQDMGPRDDTGCSKRPSRSSRELRLVVLAVLLAAAAVALLAAVTLLAAYSEYPPTSHYQEDKEAINYVYTERKSGGGGAGGIFAIPIMPFLINEDRVFPILRAADPSTLNSKGTRSYNEERFFVIFFLRAIPRQLVQYCV